jgi:hypothetical protein
VLVRGWTLREFRSFPQTRLDVAAVIFALVVAASCVEQIWFLQIQRDFAGPFLSSFLDYSLSSYLSSFRGFGMVFYAFLLIEGVALLVYASHVSRNRTEFPRRLAVAVVIGGIGASRSSRNPNGQLDKRRAAAADAAMDRLYRRRQCRRFIFCDDHASGDWCESGSYITSLVVVVGGIGDWRSIVDYRFANRHRGRGDHNRGPDGVCDAETSS